MTTGESARVGAAGDRDSAPWYKEPWPWILIALPGAAVVGSFITMYLAFSKPDVLVTDDYYEQGRNIGLQMERDERAALFGVEADLFVGADGQGVMALTRGNFDKSAPLSLKFFHPTQAGNDRVVTLTQSQSNPFQYEGKIDPPLPKAVAWNVSIEDRDHIWRLAKRWVVGAGPTLQMRPNPVLLTPEALARMKSEGFTADTYAQGEDASKPSAPAPARAQAEGAEPNAAQAGAGEAGPASGAGK